ncbi:hypothetical protein ABW21_db0208281 [Orbilia brochopaga]|nr:hypothetical protein ABW21_db0208281 [Drechslerella brochopaga]
MIYTDGFTLPHNGSDNINIDAWVLPKLSPAKRDILTDLSFDGYDIPPSPSAQKSFYLDPVSDAMVVVTVPPWLLTGDDRAYILDATSACYRTITALRLAVVDEASLPRDDRPGQDQERYVDFDRLVQGEMDEDEYARRYPEDEARSTALLDGIVCEVGEHAITAIAALANLTAEGASAAVERWRQMIAVLEVYKNTVERR